MKWLRQRYLLLPYIVLLTVLMVVGCTSKQDPSETLVTCGNHSCGDLVMVTTDTSSDGYHYLNPSLSPNGDRLLFTADWLALPAESKWEDETYTTYRQMIILPVRVGVEPRLSLEEQGAELVRVTDLNLQVWYNGDLQDTRGVRNDDKAQPVWESDSLVIFSMRSNAWRDNYRLFRADVSNPSLARLTPLFMEPEDFVAVPPPPYSQHMEPTLSPVFPDGKRWLVFTRSACAEVDSFETCTGTALWALDMTTAGDSLGYGTTFFPLTNEYSRIEKPSWSPDGSKLVFSGGMDVAGAGTGAGTELFTIDFDFAAAAAGPVDLDHRLRRLTYTSRAEGDPIAGILNTAPTYSNDGGTIYFVSTRRAPAITLHDRNIWRIPADGSLEPVIHFFTRADESDPKMLPGGELLFSSALGFPTEMLNRLEDQAYQRLSEDPEYADLTEVQLRDAAYEERRQLEFFEGVMSHLYMYRP